MPDKNTRKVFKLFFAWNEGREEAWLRAQALQGWHLASVAPFFYRFRRGEPADITYRLDFQPGGGKFDKAEYLGLFRDAGWENVGRLTSTRTTPPGRPCTGGFSFSFSSCPSSS